MHLTDPKAVLITEPDNLKRIELAGRTAYKSESKICEGSAEKFYNMLVKAGHESVLEHSNIIVQCDTKDAAKHMLEILQEYEGEGDIPHFIRYNIWEYYDDRTDTCVFSGNVRAWRSLVKRYGSEHIFVNLFFRHPLFSDIYAQEEMLVSELESISDAEAHAHIVSYAPDKIHTIATVKVTCGRAIANEIVRSRLMSFTQESTRYCKYNDIEVIQPWWYHSYSTEDKMLFCEGYLDSEERYKQMIERGHKPQAARTMLKQDVKCDIVMTGTIPAWERFFKLRDSASAHPDIVIVAKLIEEQFDLHAIEYDKE